MPTSTHRRVGAYAKLLANYASDDAIIAAGEKAELLFVRGLAFCATSDSDGWISDAQLTRIVAAGMRDAAARARSLVAAGLWERTDGGYQVRSWTKIHETAEQRGRRLKADRERKRNPDGTLNGFQPELLAESEPIPDGTPPDSLSDTRQSTTRQEHDSATELTSREERPETLPAPDATQRPPKPNHDRRRCTEHQGVTDPPRCVGCRNARERADREDTEADDREREKRDRELEERRRNCTRCDGTGMVVTEDEHRLPTGKPCTDHRRAS